MGRAIVRGAAAGFGELVSVAYEGINFALENWVGANGVDPEPVNFVVSALLPILLIVPVFDTLTYLGILPWIIRWIGRGLSAITGQPRFEAFYAIEMMFLGNTEAVAVSKLQLQRMSPARDVVIAMMTMSCVSAPILASYMQMVPAQFVLTAVPVNCLNALIVAGMLYPVDVPAEEDVAITYGEPEGEAAEATTAGGPSSDAAAVAGRAAGGSASAAPAGPDDAAAARCERDGARGAAGRGAHVVEQDGEHDGEHGREHGGEGLLAGLRRRRADRPAKEPYFSFLGDSILAAGRLILIITATVITFVALAALIDKILGAIWAPLSLEKIVGVVLYVPALLLGLSPSSAWEMSQVMGLKLVTNEFVAMGQVSDSMSGYAAHMRAVLTVFLTSFANLGTLGMIIGSFKGIVDKERNDLISATSAGCCSPASSCPSCRRRPSASSSGEPEGAPMTRKMILDLDTGIDDALAVAYAVASPEVELVGVTTTYGNVTVDTAARNTLAVLEVLGASDVPVHRGVPHPRTASSFAPSDHAARIHGRNGLGEADFPEPVGSPTDEDAVDVIIEAAHRWGEELLYVPTGASTNIAAALERDPSIKDVMGPIVMMGGALTVEGNINAWTEANVYQDPEATDLLMRSGAPVVMVGLDVTHQTLLTKAETSVWREAGTRAGRLFAEMTDYYIDYETQAVAIPGCALHDPLAVAVAIDPGLVTLLPINMQVDLDGPTRGRTIGRLDGLSVPVKSARAAVEVDSTRFLGEFTRRVGGLLAG